MRRLLGVILLAAVTLTGCSAFGDGPPPTTTYTDAQGESITVDWVDYPAHAGMGGEVLLGYADQTDIESEARTLIRDLLAAVTGASGVEMHSLEPERDWFGDENWFAQIGNGYGGESLLITVNCCELTSDGAPDMTQWQSVLDAASEVTIAAGFGPLVLEQDSTQVKADPSWEKEYRDQYCNLEGDECWRWSAHVYDGVQWIDFTIQDAALDPTGEAATWGENADGSLDSIRISYGATVVRAGKSDEYAVAMQPFWGLNVPDSTTSD